MNTQAYTPVLHTVNETTFAAMSKSLQNKLLMLVQRIDEYVAAMEPSKPVDPRQGAFHQKKLWEAIRSVIKADPMEFVPLYTELLFRINQHRDGCFSKKYANRFFDSIDIKSSDMRVFAKVMNLMLATASPGTRHIVAKQINLPRIFREMEDESIIEKFSAFYAI